MANTRGPAVKIRTTAIHPSENPQDKITHAELLNQGDIGHELDAIRSQIKRIIRYDNDGNWFDEQVVFKAQGDTNELVLGADTDLKLQGGVIESTSNLTFDDANRGQTWDAPVALSSSPLEWSQVETIFAGEKSLLAMLRDAGAAGIRSKYVIQSAGITAGTTLTVPNADWGANSANYVDILLNGQMLRGGSSADVDAGLVDYSLSGVNGIVFGFNVPNNEFIAVIVKGGGGSLGSNLGSGGGGSAGVPASAVTAATSYGLPLAVGTSTAYARADHSHGSPPPVAVPEPATATPEELTPGGAGDVGVDTTYARADHVHPLPVYPSVPEAATAIPAGLTPGGLGAVGAGSDFARADHVHPLPAYPVVPEPPQPADVVVEATLPGQAPVAGVAAQYSRADHSHGTPPVPTHSDLAGREWTTSGHTGDPLEVPYFNADGLPSSLTPPEDGDREGKVLAWVSNSVLGWARFIPGIMAISINFDRDLIYDMPNLETVEPSLFAPLPGRMVEDNDVVADIEILETNSYYAILGDEII